MTTRFALQSHTECLADFPWREILRAYEGQGRNHSLRTVGHWQSEPGLPCPLESGHVPSDCMLSSP